MRRAGKALLAACCLPLLARAHVFSLSDLNWTLRNQNGSIVIPGSLPSQTHLDLLRAGIINEPLAGINEYTERWVIFDNWTYTADLTPFAQYQEKNGPNRTLLMFYGIDTVANITFAGHPVAWVNSEFRRYTYDVSGYLESPVGGDNNVTIALESPSYYGLNLTVVDPIPQPIVNYEFPNFRELVRKPSCDFGWDWAPAYAPSGVYKPAYLITLSGSDMVSELPDDPTYPRASSAILLDETSVEVYKFGQNMSLVDQSADWVVNVTFGIRSVKSYATPTVTLSIPELGAFSQPLSLDPIPQGTEATTYVSASWSITDGLPQRWYPIDLGSPKLYDLKIALDPSGGPSSESIAQTIRTGFRTVELMQTAYSEEEIASRGITPGDQWHFKINGKTFYSKGTGVAPFDPFYTRVNPDMVRWILESAAKSGQNTVRIWGGGNYQPSDAATDGGLYDFYSLCDELGLLVWSDLMFSDEFIPRDPSFLASVELEVREHVRRVNRHPSNLQWAGGNEIELLLEFASMVSNHTYYINEFIDVWQEFLPGIVLSETHSVPYTDSSYTQGVISLDPYVLRAPTSGASVFGGGPSSGNIYGNNERYNYDITQSFNLSTFLVTRYVPEFGYRSMPSFYTWEAILESPADFTFNSTPVMARNHYPINGSLTWPNPRAPEGQYEMTSAVELWLPTPGTSDSNQTFAQWCWSTQLYQSMTDVAQLAWYRRGAGMGENNLGALVWQLNDIWPSISWSAIEYFGRWKPLNYGFASVWAPVTIQPFWMPENATLTVLAISDRWETVDGVAQLTWYDWSGRVLNTATTPFSVPSLNNSLIYEGTGLAKVLPAGHNASDVWLLMNITAQVDDETIINESYFTPISLAQANLVDPEIVMTVGDDYTFTLSAQGGVGVWTWLDHPYGTVGYFKDTTTGRASNGFYLIPGIERTVQFILNTKLSEVQDPDPSEFVVRSLWNNTHI